MDKTFEQWKQEVKDYLKNRMGEGEWDWLIGGDDDMKESYDEGMPPDEYVEMNIEDASR